MEKMKGTTLVEVVVVVVLIGILGMIFFNIIIENFEQVQTNIGENESYREDITKIYENYDNVAEGIDENISFFNKSITLRKIKGDNTPIEITISDFKRQENPFLDENGNYLYDDGEVELTDTDLINVNYINNSSDVLVIPSDKIFKGKTIDKIDWNVKGGIYVDSKLEIDSTQYIKIVTNDKLTFKTSIVKSIYLKANTGIELVGLNSVNLMQTLIESDDEIIIQGTDIFLKGTDRLLTIIKYKNFLEINGVKSDEVTNISDISGVQVDSKTIIEKVD
jgi:hypothetical protein